MHGYNVKKTESNEPLPEVDTVSFYLILYGKLPGKGTVDTGRNHLMTILLVVLSALSLYGVHLVFQPFYISILWATIVGVTFWPLYAWMRRLLGGRSSISALIVVTGIIFFFLIPSIFIIKALIVQVGYAYDSIQPYVPELIDRVSHLYPLRDETLKETVMKNLQEFGKVIITYLKSATGNIFSFIFQLIVTVLMLFFIFRDGESLLEKIKETPVVPRKDSDIFIKVTGEVIRAVIYGVIITAMVQGVLGGFGFWIVGLPAPVLFGTIMFITALIPFGGTALVWLPASIWLLYNGMIGKGIFLILWGVLVISMIDNILKPYFIGRRLGFHVLLTFIGIVGGMITFGFIGLFLGPLLLALFLRLFEMYLRGET